MECVSSVSYSVCTNGKLSEPFSAQIGLSQEDPISPFLFALAMDYLSRLLAKMDNPSKFKFHPKCGRVGSHN